MSSSSKNLWIFDSLREAYEHCLGEIKIEDGLKTELRFVGSSGTEFYYTDVYELEVQRSASNIKGYISRIYNFEVRRQQK